MIHQFVPIYIGSSSILVPHLYWFLISAINEWGSAIQVEISGTWRFNQNKTILKFSDHLLKICIQDLWISAVADKGIGRRWVLITWMPKLGYFQIHDRKG
jgi:hypothetical protein